MRGLWPSAPVILLMTTVAVCPVLAGPPASGLQKGDAVEPWNPVHVAGPDQGTCNCPVCTYLGRPAVVVFAKDGPDVTDLVTRLERLVVEHQRNELKGFLAVHDAGGERLKRIAADAKVSRSSLCGMSAKTRDKDLRAYRIDPRAASTIMIYRDYKVVATFVNLSPKDFGQVEAAVKKLWR